MEIMVKMNVSTAKEAYELALKYPETRPQLIDLINEPYYAFLWTKNIGDRDIMIDRVTNSEDAYFWAQEFGNQDIMIDRVTDPYYTGRWIETFGGEEYFRAKDLPWFSDLDDF
jgi:hypothetical protein